MLLVDGLGEEEGVSTVVQRLELAIRIEGVQGRVTQHVERIAVDSVGAALGDGVDLSAGGLAELDGVVGGFGLELLDGVDGVNVGRTRRTAASFREEHLVVVGAVDVVLVVEAGDAVEADQAVAAVLDDVRRAEHEGAPVAGAYREVREQFGSEGLRDFGLLRVEDRGFGVDLDGGGNGRGGKGGVDGEHLADGQGEILAVELAEGCGAGNDFIVAGDEEVRSVDTGTVGSEGTGDTGVGVDHDDGGARNRGSRGVGDSADDVAVAGGLGGDGQRGAERDTERGDVG